MPPSLDALVPEVLGRLIGYFDIEVLLTIRAAGPGWRVRTGAAEAVWRTCYKTRFGRPPKDPPVRDWARAYGAALEGERATAASWSAGNLQQEDVFIFSSFVRSWACDRELLVAGLFDGRLQPLLFSSGRAGRPFAGRHGDEVVCVALNDHYVLSGSGDPGYHHRQPSDSSVKLWSRGGSLLASFRAHEDTVRGVVLFPSSTAFGAYGLSAGLDAQVVLWSLEAHEPSSTLRLPGPCRCLRHVPAPGREGSSEGLASAPEARVLAGAGEAVAELAVRPREGQGAELTLLQVVHVKPCLVSGLDCYVSPRTWVELPAGALYPPSLLLCPSAAVAGGSTDGRLWALGPQREGRVVLAPLMGGGFVAEVVSVEILEGRQLLAICRTGVLCLAEWREDISEASVSWAKQGWRMYVSTLRRREPSLLVTDGFDNAICTLRVGLPRGPSRKLDESSESDNGT